MGNSGRHGEGSQAQGQDGRRGRQSARQARRKPCRNARRTREKMKSPYVNELKPNQLVETSFLVQSKEIRQKKGGELYLTLFLADRTGELDAKMWDNVADVLNEFERDDFVKVKGIIQVFHNKPQMTIHKVRRMDESEVQFSDYFPSSKRDAGEMWLELRGIVAAVSNPALKGFSGGGPRR